MRIFKYLICNLLLILPFTVAAQRYHGMLEVLVLDNFEKNKSFTHYQLNEAGMLYRLELPNFIDKNQLITGIYVHIKGKERQSAHGKVIKVESLSIDR